MKAQHSFVRVALLAGSGAVRVATVLALEGAGLEVERAEGIEGAVTLSAFRSTFAEQYGLKMIDGPLAGLCARVVIVVDEKGKVAYQEQVPEITHEPDYDRALAALK